MFYNSNNTITLYLRYVRKEPEGLLEILILRPHWSMLSHYAASMDILNTEKVSNFVFNDCGVRKASR